MTFLSMWIPNTLTMFSKQASSPALSKRLFFLSNFNIIQRENGLKQARLLYKKRHMPYTSLGEQQTMQVLHNKSQKFLAAIKKVSSEFLMHSKNRLISAKKKSGSTRTVTPSKESELVRLCEENRK